MIQKNQQDRIKDNNNVVEFRAANFAPVDPLPSKEKGSDQRLPGAGNTESRSRANRSHRLPGEKRGDQSQERGRDFYNPSRDSASKRRASNQADLQPEETVALVTRQVRHSLDQFLRFHLQSSTPVGLRAESCEPVNVSELRAELEEICIRSQMEADKDGDISQRALENAAVSAEVAESIGEFLIYLRGNISGDLAGQNEQEDLFAMIVQLKTELASGIQGLALSAMQRAVTAEMEHLQQKALEAGLEDGETLEIQPQEGGIIRRNMLRAEQLVSEGAPRVLELEREVSKELRAISTILQSYVPGEIGFLEDQSDQEAPSVQHLRKVLSRAGNELEKIFNQNGDDTAIGIQLRSMAHNLQGTCDMLNVFLTRGPFAEGVAAGRVAEVMLRVLGAQKANRAVRHTVQEFIVSLKEEGRLK